MNGRQQRDAATAPARCADVLESSLRGLGFDRVIRHLALLRAWNRAIAGRIKERARIEDFKGGCLYLSVEDPIWMHELHMLRHQLKTMLNKEVGEPTVDDIVLRMGRTRRSSTRTRTHRGRQRVGEVSPAVEAGLATLLTPLRELPFGDAIQRLFQRWASRPS